MPKMKISENENSHKNTFSKNEVARLKIVACSVLKQMYRQTNKKAKTEAALSGLSELLALAHHQGAVQLYMICHGAIKYQLRHSGGI